MTAVKEAFVGHLGHPEEAYRLLQKRLAQKIQGAPDSPTLMKILSMLFSPEDADLACRLPHNLTSLTTLSRRLSIPKERLIEQLTNMAERGLVFDIQINGKKYYTLPPVVIGLFEFTFMRMRPDMPMKELAHLFEQYFYENDARFSHGLLEGKTSMFRSLVREEAIPNGNAIEVLDWERATKIVSSSSAVSVGICQCQHTAEHLGEACNKPGEVCLSFNFAAEGLARNGIARAITKNEAMMILQKSKEAGLAQTADNVQNKPAFICNCCGCCCHVMRGIKTLDNGPGIVTSNFIRHAELSKCNGCGACARACPVDAITMEKRTEGTRQVKRAVHNDQSCLGCGVCATVCKTGATTMKSRQQRVLVPETVFDQRVMMAIERGRLADLIFDDPGKLSHRALSRVLGAIERLPLVRAMMAAQTLNSSFVRRIVQEAKKKSGAITDIVS